MQPAYINRGCNAHRRYYVGGYGWSTAATATFACPALLSLEICCPPRRPVWRTRGDALDAPGGVSLQAATAVSSGEGPTGRGAVTSRWRKGEQPTREMFVDKAESFLRCWGREVGSFSGWGFRGVRSLADCGSAKAFFQRAQSCVRLHEMDPGSLGTRIGCAFSMSCAAIV